MKLKINEPKSPTDPPRKKGRKHKEVSPHLTAEEAQKAGKFTEEIISVELKDRKGRITYFDQDEHIRYGSEAGQLSKLKPAFKKRRSKSSTISFAFRL